MWDLNLPFFSYLWVDSPMAGQPTRKHMWQAMHLSSSTKYGGWGLRDTKMHSPRVIKTEGPSNSRHSFSPDSTSLILKASTTLSFSTPMARTTASRSTFFALRSSRTAQSTPGWSW